MDYKLELYKLKFSRKIVAQRIGMSYAALNARLNNFTPWQFREETELRKLIAQAAEAQAAEMETRKTLYYV
jgi:hypothetical protein